LPFLVKHDIVGIKSVSRVPVYICRCDNTDGMVSLTRHINTPHAVIPLTL